MNIKDVLSAIHRMWLDGVVASYAIGGAVGATFYLEPISTLDVDVFVQLNREPGRLVVTLDPIFNFLKECGGVVEGEYITLSGWPVQIFPPTGLLVEEALAEAHTFGVDEIEVRVFSAEHLAAIALETGRAKDKARLLQFIEAGILDEERFREIIGRHALSEPWETFQRQFFGTA
jgi:hypothetical protein